MQPDIGFYLSARTHVGDKGVEKIMRNTTWYMLGSLGGLAFTTVMGYYTGQGMGAMAGMLGGVISFIIVAVIITQAKSKGFLPLFWNLEMENNIKKEKYCFVPNKFGKLRIIVAKMVADGVIFIRRYGLIDDKGTEYNFGNSPLSFVLPNFGFTKDLVQSQYHHKLRKDKNINDWDEAIKKYLGEGSQTYKLFLDKFRSNPEPNAKAIQDELQWLKDIKNPADPLELKVCGETVSFHDDIDFFKYIYHPQQMKVFVENEKMNVKLREQGYHEDAGKKWMSMAKAAAIIIIVIMVALLALSQVDLSHIGNLFGGGAKTVAPVVNSTVHP
jgi:hypothetical protein